MLRPLDRDRRNGPLYPGATRTLPACFDATHLLVQIDTAFDFAALAAGLEGLYHEQIGRPGIHPEIVLRALTLAGVYGVPSNRQLCERIAENLAWRWFCCYTLDDRVFDHFTLSVFLQRAGAEKLYDIVHRLNEGLAEAGVLSPHGYFDSSLVAANVRTQDLQPRDPDAPPPTAVPEEGVWEARVVTPPDAEAAPGTPTTIETARYQDAAGRLPLPQHDRDARWRTIRGTTVLGYKEHIVADRSGFILARGTTAADVSDVAGALRLLDDLPSALSSAAADTGYRAGRFRHALQRRGITPYIPLDAMQQKDLPAGFIDHGDHFVCPLGVPLLPQGMPDADDCQRYVAATAACQHCVRRPDCVAPSQAAKHLWASRYRITVQRARRLNATRRYQREQRRRQTVVEGTFARLDRLGGTRARYRGRDRVDGHGTLTAIAHNMLKALTKRRFWRRGGAVQPCPAPVQPVAAA